MTSLHTQHCHERKVCSFFMYICTQYLQYTYLISIMRTIQGHMSIQEWHMAFLVYSTVHTTVYTKYTYVVYSPFFMYICTLYQMSIITLHVHPYKSGSQHSLYAVLYTLQYTLSTPIIHERIFSAQHVHVVSMMVIPVWAIYHMYMYMQHSHSIVDNSILHQCTYYYIIHDIQDRTWVYIRGITAR